MGQSGLARGLLVDPSSHPCRPCYLVTGSGGSAAAAALRSWDPEGRRWDQSDCRRHTAVCLSMYSHLTQICAEEISW